MNSEEFEMFLNFTKLLTDMGKQLAEIKTELGDIKQLMPFLKRDSFVVDYEKDEESDDDEGFEIMEFAEPDDEADHSARCIPVTHPSHPDYVPPNVAGRKSRSKASDFLYAPLVKRIDALLKKETIGYEKKYTKRGQYNCGVRYYNAWPLGRPTKSNFYKLAFLEQDVCAFISKLRGVENVYIHTNPRTSKRSIVVKFTKRRK